MIKFLCYSDIYNQSGGDIMKMLVEERFVNQKSCCTYRNVSSETEHFVMHYHDFFEIFLVTRGNIRHIVNGGEQNLKVGDLVFIRPNDIHDYECEGARFINLTLSHSTIDKLFSYLEDSYPSHRLIGATMPPLVSLSEKEYNNVVSRLENLNTVHDDTELKLKVRLLLADIFVKYFISFTSGEVSEIPKWLKDTCMIMNNKKNFSAGIAQMVRLSGKSREHLSRSVKKFYGVTVSEYINNLRLNYIANALITSDIPIIDLCFECGFENLSWFYKLFQKKYGVTPSKYRKLGKF